MNNQIPSFVKSAEDMEKSLSSAIIHIHKNNEKEEMNKYQYENQKEKQINHFQLKQSI